MRMSRARSPSGLTFGGARFVASGSFGLVANVAAALWTWWRQRRALACERRTLAQLTDWELRDIGLSRDEADAEAEKWFWRR